MLQEPGKFATLAEVEHAIDELRDEDWFRLEKVAKFHVYRYPGIDPKEVLGESVSRMLGDERHWPRGVEFLTCFRNVLRSVADELREREKERINPRNVELSVIEDSEDHSTESDHVFQQAADRQTVEHIWKLFADDEQVQALIFGAEEDLTAAEVQQQFNLTAAEYDAARKRLERLLAKHFQKGWPR